MKSVLCRYSFTLATFVLAGCGSAHDANVNSSGQAVRSEEPASSAAGAVGTQASGGGSQAETQSHDEKEAESSRHLFLCRMLGLKDRSHETPDEDRQDIRIPGSAGAEGSDQVKNTNGISEEPLLQKDNKDLSLSRGGEEHQEQRRFVHLACRPLDGGKEKILWAPNDKQKDIKNALASSTDKNGDPSTAFQDKQTASPGDITVGKGLADVPAPGDITVGKGPAEQERHPGHGPLLVCKIRGEKTEKNIDRKPSDPDDSDRHHHAIALVCQPLEKDKASLGQTQEKTDSVSNEKGDRGNDELLFAAALEGKGHGEKHHNAVLFCREFHHRKGEKAEKGFAAPTKNEPGSAAGAYLEMGGAPGNRDSDGGSSGEMRQKSEEGHEFLALACVLAERKLRSETPTTSIGGEPSAAPVSSGTSSALR